MILGTVQLGLAYGINNKTGKPEREQGCKILDIAYENGIRMLDTGPMYGNSEEVIGRYQRETGKFFLVNTKLPDVIPDEKNLTGSFIERTLQNSMDRLYLDRIHCYYLHQYAQCKNHKIMELLMKAREKKYFEKIGVSIYHPHEMLFICESLKGIVDVIQIPYNIFSVSFWEEALKKAEAAGIIVYARSLFLQGMVFLPPKCDFSKKIGAEKYILYVQELAKRRKQKIEQTCYDAVAETPALTDVILGVETAEQLLCNLDLEKNHKSFSGEEWKAVLKYMQDIPPDILNPITWEKYREKN